MRLIRECPKCKSKHLKYLPWLGEIYECKKCGYRGPLTLEKLTKRKNFKSRKT